MKAECPQTATCSSSNSEIRSMFVWSCSALFHCLNSCFSSDCLVTFHFEVLCNFNSLRYQTIIEPRLTTISSPYKFLLSYDHNWWFWWLVRYRYFVTVVGVSSRCKRYLSEKDAQGSNDLNRWHSMTCFPSRLEFSSLFVTKQSSVKYVLWWWKRLLTFC